MINYKKKYLKIYIWQAVSIILGFSSLFIVVPHLSSNKVLYGIYSVCTSLTIFFSYADLGFLGSGMKYAAEYYIKGDYKNEIRVVGFTAFFMIIAFFVIDVFILYIGVNPTLLIPELKDGTEDYHIAQVLIITLAAGCPLIIAQRIIQMIFTIRVEDYIFQRVSIIGSCIRILSVFVFFGDGRYLITYYYIFYQFVSLLIIVSLLYHVRRYGYSSMDFLKAFKFDKQVFDKEKSLSFASLLFMISMILYNELDQVVISKLFGVESVAIYAIAFSMMTFIRTFCSMIYSPYSSRYNHFVGLGDYEGLIRFTNKMMIIISPILIIPIFNVALYSKQLVISWVGESYIDSAIMTSFMVMSYAVNGILQPLNCYMIACEKNSKITIGALLLPIVYWVGIILISSVANVASFAIMKLIAPVLLFSYFWVVIKKDIVNQGFVFLGIKDLLSLLLPPILFSIVLYFIVSPEMYMTHEKLALILNIIVIVSAIMCSLVFSLVSNKELREYSLSIIRSIANNYIK